jgi:hypothetical protein
MVQRLLDVYRPDAGVRMGTAQDFAMQHPRHCIVPAIERLPGNLFYAIMPDGTRPNNSEIAIRDFVGFRHDRTSQCCRAIYASAVNNG